MTLSKTISKFPLAVLTVVAVTCCITATVFGQSGFDAFSKDCDPFLPGNLIGVSGVVGQVDSFVDDFYLVQISWSTGDEEILWEDYVFKGWPVRFGPLQHDIEAPEAPSVNATLRLIRKSNIDGFETWTLIDSLDVQFLRRPNGPLNPGGTGVDPPSGI